MKQLNFASVQKGSVLIVVLIMLVLLTVAGTWAIRSSMTNLNVATNSQAQSLLMQTSDSVFFALENATDNALRFANMRIGDGMLAYVMRAENKNKELVMCIRGAQNDHFSGSRFGSVVYWSGNTIKNSDLGTRGFCKMDRGSDFISARDAVLTQISIRAADNTEDWEQMYEGQDKDSAKKQDVQKVVITATSIIPNLSSASKAEINGCLRNFTSFYDEVADQDTVTDCLAAHNVPYSTQDMEYTLRDVDAS
ncbi:MAG: hypothetical protein VX875_06270 [Pseudomonadota bacterium]|nr:hypothetical protein [Pseudomonadota bacterium]